MKWVGVKCMLLVCMVATLGVAEAAPEKAAANAWESLNSFRVSLIKSPDNPHVMKMGGQIDATRRDFVVEVDSEHGEKPLRLMSIGDGVLVSQGAFDNIKGLEPDIMAAAYLQHGMAILLLASVFPEGYGSIKGTQKFEHVEPAASIQFSLGGANQLNLAAPWKISGSVTRVSATQITYDFAAESNKRDVADTQPPSQTMWFRGEAGLRSGPAIPDDLPLDDWDLSRFQPPAISNGSAAVKTVADVRALLAEWEKPGVPDPAHDYTGFWRTDCAQPIGMRIRRQGEAGMYSILLCGADRCLAEDRALRSFITGDQKYSVVDGNTIDFHYPNGRTQRYQRCGQ